MNDQFNLKAGADPRLLFGRRLSCLQVFWQWFVPCVQNVLVVLFAAFLFAATVVELYIAKSPPAFAALGVEVVALLLCQIILYLPIAVRELEALSKESLSGYSHRIGRSTNKPPEPPATLAPTCEEENRMLTTAGSGEFDQTMVWIDYDRYKLKNIPPLHRHSSFEGYSGSFSSSLLFEASRAAGLYSRAAIPHSMSHDNLYGGGDRRTGRDALQRRQLALDGVEEQGSFRPSEKGGGGGAKEDVVPHGRRYFSRASFGGLTRRCWHGSLETLVNIWQHLVVPIAFSKSCFLSLLLRSVVWCCVWLWATAYMERPPNNKDLTSWNFDELPEAYYFVEAMFLWMVTFDYCVGLLVATSKWRYVFSLMSVIDLATMPVTMFFIKVIARAVMDGPAKERAENLPWLLIFGYLRFIRLVKTESILSVCFPGMRAVTMRIIAIVITIITIVLTFAGCMFTLEAPVPSTNYNNVFDFFYYAIVTVATVGYGDFSPVTTAGRTVAMIAIVCTLSYLPGEIQRLMEALRTPRTLLGSLPSAVEDYLCFVGPMQPSQLVVLCREMTHTFPGSVRRIVLVTPLEVAIYKTVCKAALRKGGIRICVKGGSRGNPYPSKLRQILSQARAVFVVCDTRCYEGNHATWWEGIEINEQEEDQLTLLRFMGARAVCWPIRPISVQLIHDYRKGLVTEMGAYYIVCLNEVKMKLMSKSCGDCPGFLALVGNWFYRPVKDMVSTRGKRREEDLTDMMRYADGARYQLYRMDFPPCMKGMCYDALVRLFYKMSNVFLIGIVSITKEVWLNPVGYVVEEETLFYTTWPFAGLVLAPSLDVVVRLSNAKDLSFSHLNADDAPLRSVSGLAHSERLKDAKSIVQLHTHPPPTPLLMNARSVDKSPIVSPSADVTAFITSPVVRLPPSEGPLSRSLTAPLTVVRHLDSTSRRELVAGLVAVETVADARRTVFAVPHLELVLLCGWPRGVRLFLRALRASGDYNMVILSPTHPVNIGTNELGVYSQCCCYIRGSALDTTDLVRAGALQARSCSVFSTSHVVWRGDLSAHKLDTQAIIVKKTIQTLFNAYPADSIPSKSNVPPHVSMTGEVASTTSRPMLAFLTEHKVCSPPPPGSPTGDEALSRSSSTCEPAEDDFLKMAPTEPIVVVELREAAYLEYMDSSIMSVPETHSRKHDDIHHLWDSRGSYNTTPEFASGRVFIEEMFYGLMAYTLPVSRYAMDATIMDYLVEGPNPSVHTGVFGSPHASRFRLGNSWRRRESDSDERGRPPPRQYPSFSSASPSRATAAPPEGPTPSTQSRGPMFLVDVPLPFVDSSFKRLFSHMFRYHKAIALGIYRFSRDPGPPGIHDQRPPNIVLSCPGPDVKLKSDDKIYIVRHCYPEELHRIRSSPKNATVPYG
eukprot:GHVS01041730.1.p1 GENE.GHVS01041730.1~~GHVS01041730.1.p1  ORF type:complete len:1392 (-),score=166.29 GHVS01041730.1:286-4461(-)